jgi:hypothetical protein
MPYAGASFFAPESGVEREGKSKGFVEDEFVANFSVLTFCQQSYWRVAVLTAKLLCDVVLPDNKVFSCILTARGSCKERHVNEEHKQEFITHVLR